MKAAVNKHQYGKLKKKDIDTIAGLSEPHRVSMYDVLLENLRIAKRATFLHRIIYVGEHSFPHVNDLSNVFETIIKKCNETYCIEKLSGFLLMYEKYFVHMVEGDEDNLNKHLGIIFDKEQPHYENFGTNMKLLAHISHINQRFFEEWTFYSGVPSKLLESLDLESDLQSSSRYIYNCVRKVYTLAAAISQENVSKCMDEASPLPKRTIEDDPKPSLSRPSGPSIASERSFLSRSSIISTSQLSSGAHQYRLLLPEYELLDFVLNTNVTMDLFSYYSLYGVVPMRDIYKDRVWPVPSDFIPYDVFEKPYDCMTEIPKEKKGSVKTDEASPVEKVEGVSSEGEVLREASGVAAESNTEAPK